MHKYPISRAVLFCAVFFCMFAACLAAVPFVRPALAQATIPAEYAYQEAQVVYYTNLKRQENGVPPLRWNQEVSDAARWFSYDSVANRATAYCGHDDTLGRGPGARMGAFGFPVGGSTWAENVVCGYTDPVSAVDAWYQSEGHRANMLNPDLQEIGVGYYWDEGERRGYVTMDLITDPSYGAVIINHEALSAQSADVSLHIYRPRARQGFAGFGQAQEMMVSNGADFAGSQWEPYATQKGWRLAEGEGWRTVYVKLRDSMGRTVVTHDIIYLGGENAADAPREDVTPAHASAINESLRFSTVQMGEWSELLLRLNWLADDGDPSFWQVSGGGEQATDGEAVGGTAYTLRAGLAPAIVQLSSRSLPAGVPMQAFFRLKVDDNTTAEEIVLLSIEGGGTQYGPIRLRGQDFAAAGRYQEFALPFIYRETEDDALLKVEIEAPGETAVSFDAVTFYHGVAAASPLDWAVPGGRHRNASIFARFTGSGGMSDEVEVYAGGTIAAEGAEPQPTPGPTPEPMPEPGVIVVSPTSLDFFAAPDTVGPAAEVVNVQCGGCTGEWTVRSEAEWLRAQRNGSQIVVSVVLGGLEPGVYASRLIVSDGGGSDVAPVTIEVEFIVAEELTEQLFLPATLNQ